MQGGHEDHFRPGHAPDSPSRKEAQALIRPDVTQEVSLPKFNLVDDTQVDGTMFDRAVNLLRFYSSRNVSRVVALFCGFTDIEKFRKHKLERVAQGRKVILDIQLVRKKWYAPFLDKYFEMASFCAEEEFYLITLPFLFWNLDWLFAHHLLYVVNIGLYIGNVMKDVFALPRPSKVWRPASLAQTDSLSLIHI